MDQFCFCHYPAFYIGLKFLGRLPYSTAPGCSESVHFLPGPIVLLTEGVYDIRSGSVPDRESNKYGIILIEILDFA